MTDPAAFCAAWGAADEPALSITRQGYLFAGGGYDAAHPGDHIVGQLYAEFQVPSHRTHPYPIVMIPGGGQTGTNFTGTPDGREGWAQFFLRRGYAVYVVDQVGRGKAPYVADVYGPMASVPRDFVLQRFAAPERFNLWPQAHLHTQWPGKAEPGDPVFDQFLASQVPSITDFVEQQRLNSAAAAALLDRIPVVIIQSEASYHASYDHCTAQYLTQAGVANTYIRLADRGIHGNGHMMMIEKNNLAIAGVIADWLAKAVPARGGRAP